MKRMNKNIQNILSAALAAVMLVSVFPARLRADGGIGTGVSEAKETIYVSNADELINLSDDCSLDSWSVGKVVEITADISLEGRNFEPIPTFSGILNGNGHTISGLEISKGSTPTGFISRVKSGGLVRDLKINGTVSSSGSGEGVGGVVGSNAGTIINCSFNGIIKGKTSVGGIVGENLTTGELYDCSSSGNVTGESKTGGIVGNNSGTITNSTNHAGINTASVDHSLSLSDLNINLDLTKLSEFNLLGTINVASDTGGVAGYSSGMIMGCKNDGTVGYPHIGYNNGGIAGRSGGFVSGCENTGTVNGRKDIGGIVGQSEPYMTLDLSEDNLSKLQRQLDELSDIATDTVNDAGDGSDKLSDRLSSMNNYLTSATGSVKKLGGQVSDTASQAVGEINRLSNVAADVVSRINNMTGTVDQMSTEITAGLDKLSESIDELAEASAIGSDALDELAKASDSAAEALESGRKHASQIVDGFDELRASLKIKDKDAIRRALDKIGDGFDELSSLSGDLESALNSLRHVLLDHGWTDDAVNDISELGSEIKAIGTEFSKISKEIKNISNSITVDSDKLDEAVKLLDSAFDSFDKASDELNDALDKAHSATEKLTAGIKKLIGGLDIGDKDAVDSALAEIQESLSELGDAFGTMNEAAVRVLLALGGIDFLDTDGLEGALEELRDSAASSKDSVAKIIGSLKVIRDNVTIVKPNPSEGFRLISEGFDDMKASIDLIKASTKDFTSGLDSLRKGLSALRDAIALKDIGSVKSSLDNINTSLGNIAVEIRNIGRTIEDLATVMDRMFIWGDRVVDRVARIGSLLADAADSIGRIASGISDIRDQVSFDDKKFDAGLDDLRDGVNGLIDDSKGIEDSISYISGAMSGLSEAGDKLSSALSGMSDSVDMFKAASESFTGLSREFSSIIDYLAGVDPIQLPQTSGEIKSTANQLYAQVNGVSKQVELLTADMSDVSGTLREDILAINDKFGEIRQTISDIFAGGEDYDIKDIFTDTSEANIDSMTSGKIAASKNGGKVDGDLNVGGIVGSMAIEHEQDPEDDTHDSSLLNRVYESRSAIVDSTNSGAITSKKNGVGGICGRMELGVIHGCENYGFIKSESGTQVGGIAGSASSKIRDCYVKSNLSGSGYVGGIIGVGSTNLFGEGSSVSDCLSIVEISDATEFYGAIAGAEGGEFSGNRYVSDDLRGVDRMSIDGGAQAIGYNTLVEAEDTPKEFKKFTLRFVADDVELKSVKFDYGDSFGKDAYPEIPAKDGYYAVWSRDELNELHFDTTVEAVYIRDVTAIPSEQTRGGKPMVLVEGTFDQNDTLEVTSQPIDRSRFDNIAGSYFAAVLKSLSKIGKSFPPAYVGRDIIEQWKVTIPDDGAETHTVRLATPTDTKPAIYVEKDGVFEKVDSDTAGKYFVFEVDGLTAEFAVVTESAVWIAWIVAAAIVLLPLIIIFIVVKSIKKRRRAVKAPEPKAAPYIIHSSDPETERREREIAELRILLEKERNERADLARQVEDLKNPKSSGEDKDDSAK